MRAAPAPRWPAVVFDLDGTLVDTIALIVESYRHAFSAVLSIDVPPARIRRWIGRPLLHCFQEVSTEHANKLFAVYMEWNQANAERLGQPYAGIDTLVTDLQAAGVRVAVATSKRLVQTRVALGLAGLTGTVDTLVTMEDTARHKPDPEPLLLAARLLDVAPADAVYVGDAVVDVLAAQAAGMQAVAVLWGAGTSADLQRAGPTVLVDSVEQLRSVLLRTPAAA